MRQLIALSALAVAAAVSLVAAGAASAGGWATVSLDPLPSSGLEAGETWSTEITYLQHGVTPLGGINPVVTIVKQGSGATHAFKASATRQTGVYEARVAFPEAGRWNVAVESDWWGENTLTFGPVNIGEGPTGIPLGGDSPLVPVALLLFVLVLLAAATFGVRRWRPRPAGR